MSVQPQISAPSFTAQSKELLTLAAPMIGVTVSRMMMGFIDFAMVSTLGTAAQAAISPCALLLFTIACLGMGMSQGVQTFVSQAIGRGEPQRAGTFVWQTMYIAVAATLLSIPIALLTPMWFPFIATAGAHSPAVAALEIQFLSIALLSIGPMTASAGLESFYNGIRRPGICLTAVIASLVTITVANYVLIFGHFGAPKMGIAGSAVATLLAWCARLAILLAPFTTRAIDATYHTRRGWGLSWPRLLDIVRVGGPIALQWLTDIGAWLVFMELLMPPFGEVAMAGANLAIQFMHLSFMPALGIGMALTTQVGNAVGAQRYDVAEQRVRVGLRLILIYMGLMGVIFVACGGPLASLLCFEADGGRRAAVIAAAAAMLIWVALFQLSDALCIVYSFAFRGAGDTRVPAVLFAGCCWGIFVLGGWCVTRFRPEFGYNGLWATCTLYIVVLSGLLWWRFRSGAWRNIRIFDQQRGQPVAGH